MGHWVGNHLSFYAQPSPPPHTHTPQKKIKIKNEILTSPTQK